MEKLLRGEITGEVMGELRRVLPKKNLMVFVSSTFLDTNLERDILHRKILPELQRKAQQHDVQVIFYDMRFGVKDENTLDHMTWVACKDAIQQCHEGSDGLFFLSLQADRYGYLPLPKYLDEAILLQARKDHENDSNFPEVAKFLDEWYRLDENCHPPRYELKRLSMLRDPEFEKAFPLLKNCLLDSVTFESLKGLPEEIVVNRSVTQWETFYAFDCDKERCYWIQRVFGKAALRAFKDSSDCWKITDIFSDESNTETDTVDENTLSLLGGKKVDGRSTAKKLEVLHAKMKMYLTDEQRVELSAQISPEAYLKGEGCEEYLDQWERVTRDCLEKELKKVLDKSEHWNAGFAGIPVDHLAEIVHHCSIAFAKANSFFGREGLLYDGLELIKNKKQQQEVGKEGKKKDEKMEAEQTKVVEKKKKEQETKRTTKGALSEGKGKKKNEVEPVVSRHPLFSGICLAVVGKSGCGKTALMSKLALSLSCSEHGGGTNEIPMIIRFCGTSRFSLNGLKLVQSISLQILAVYGRQNELQELESLLPSQDYKTAVEYFQKLVSQYPIYLFIDSLDQLENRYEERSKLTFLRDLKPHEQSRIVVSTLPDEYEKNGKPGQYFYHCETTLKNDSVPMLDVGIVTEVEVTIKSLLASRQKKLTNDQWVVTLQAVSHEPTILYTNLAMEVISQWRSFEKEVVLRPTVKGLIHQIFGNFELSYGKEFTSIAFAMITFSREGVNDPELKDLLSLHEGVMTEVCQYSKLHCFPMHAWLRLKQVIKNLVTEKENHCMKWYHRQLWETASERYSEKEKECHEIMGKYFGNLYDVDLKKEKDIMSQPLILNDISIWMTESIVNRRRVVEGYYHLIKGGLLQEAVEEVCSLEFVCCSASAGDLLNYVRYLGELVQFFGDDNRRSQQLGHYYRWVRKRATKIVVDPRRQTRMTAGEEPLISIVKKEISQLEERERFELGGYTLQPITFDCRDDFDVLEMELEGHTYQVMSVAWSHDGSKILSGSSDLTLKIWDGMTGELLNTLEGHSGAVESVTWNHDDSRIASSSADGTIKIWDGATCELLMTLVETRSLECVCSASWNHDGSKIASTSTDGKVRIWNAINGILLLVLSGHTACTHSAFWNNDSTKIVSASADNTIKIWNVSTGKLLKSLEGHSRPVQTASWNHDESLIVSASADKTIKIWDGKTNELLQTLKGHSAAVHSVIWNRDGSRILSGSNDGSMRIWNAVSGQIQEIVSETAGLRTVAWHPDERRIASGGERIQVWKGWKKEARKKSHWSRLSEWNPVDSTRIISGSEDGTIKIWDGKKGILLKSWEGHSKTVTAIVWNHDGTRIASGSYDKTVKVWDGVSYELLMTLEGHSDSVKVVSWNRDSSRILSAAEIYSKGTEFFLWDGMTGEKLKTVTRQLGDVSSAIWNHSSSKLLIVDWAGVIAVWDGKSLKEDRRIVAVRAPDNGWYISSVSWNHDSSKIISSRHGMPIQIWDAESGALLNSLTGHTDDTYSVFWNHDDSKIFSGSKDGTIRIWDGNTGQLLKTESFGGTVDLMRLTKEEDRIAFSMSGFFRCFTVPNL
jgi:WD40 repeat protein